MSSRKLLNLTIVVASVWPSAVTACVNPPPPLHLPNETDDAYILRTEATLKARADEDARRFQAHLFDQADRVELAIVRQSIPIPFAEAGGLLGAKIAVETVTSLKGSGPAQTITLADTRVTTCGIGGSGTATGARPGEYVIVFYNISFQDNPRPFGIKIMEAREPRIVDALDDAAVRLRDQAIRAKPTP